MCGIVGIVKLDPREHVEQKRLKQMQDVLSHRGPDGEGLWIEGPVGFGHRRLAIVDVAGGQQPMANEDQTVWIVFNGEIYNHPTLRPELEARGHRYRTRSDTETILHLYEEEGERCVERLQGMFAFAIWDSRQEVLFLARDRIGIKPLYYWQNHRCLVFGSEIKSLLADPEVEPHLDLAMIDLSFSPPASSRVRRPFSAGYESCCPGELSHGPPLTRSESDATGGCLSRWTDRGRSSRCGHANCGVD